MPNHCIARQLQTPPNTWDEKKKERPLSWEVDEDSRKKAKIVDDDGILEGAKGLKSERTLVHNGVPLGDTARQTECDGQVLIATDTEDKSDTYTVLSEDFGGEDTIPGNEGYPRLPIYPDSRCVDFKEVGHVDRSTIAHRPTATTDFFSPALDYIALDTSTDYGDFSEDLTDVTDLAGLDHVSASGPRIEPGLCDEQLALVELIMNGKNVFYTGSAGCGKSTVLKHFVTLLKRKGKRVDILAPTGRAALEVNGRTLHNYAGWIPSSLGQPLQRLASNARGRKVQKRLGRTDVLIIDEISMVANHVLERLNCIMKSARHSKRPFGGVQMIVTGDFCQLPPVKGFKYCLHCGTTLQQVCGEGSYKCVKAECLALFQEIDKWAFRSAAWQEAKFEHVNLNVIHRQKDAKFKALLEKRRLGIPYTVKEKWRLLDHQSETKDAVKLFPMRKEVRETNEMEFAQLPGRALTYCCVDDFAWNSGHDDLGDKGKYCRKPKDHVLEALKDHSLEPNLVLKEGMLVILLVNWDLDSRLANGSQGTIVGFEQHNQHLFPEVPRKWEYSSHKNSLLRKFVERTAVQEWPIVQFLNGPKRTIYPRCMINDLGDDEPYSLLSRTQIPLTAAWAMTVHKAQGMTLSRVIVDLRDTFEPGQDYVALSRAETLDGLKVVALPERYPGPDEQVIEFLAENDLMPAFCWNGSDDTTSELSEESE